MSPAGEHFDHPNTPTAIKTCVNAKIAPPVARQNHSRVKVRGYVSVVSCTRSLTVIAASPPAFRRIGSSTEITTAVPLFITEPLRSREASDHQRNDRGNVRPRNRP